MFSPEVLLVGALHSLFLLSGAAGLMYEVVWTRWLTGVMGSASTATALVLAVFMAGLGWGSYLAGQVADRLSRPVRVYAWLELIVVAFVLLPLGGARITGWLLVTLAARFGATSPILEAAGVVMAVLAMAPPTILMGASLPLVVRALATSESVLARRMATAYAANTFGGAVGTIAAGFLLIEAIGLRSTCLVAGGLSVVVWIAALWLDRHWVVFRPEGGDTAQIHHRSRRRQRNVGVRTAADVQPSHAWPVGMLLATGVSGFCALGYETVWIRVLSLLTLNTTYAFSLMLAMLLCGLTLGSWLVRRWLDRSQNQATWFVVLQTLLAVYALGSMLAVPQFALLAERWASSDGEHVVPHFLWRPLVLSFALLMFPTILMGASLPVACKTYASLTTGIARPVGRIYAANTLGSVLGSLVIGLGIIPVLGSWWGVAVCAGSGALAAAGVAWTYSPPRHQIIVTLIACATAIVAVIFGGAFGHSFVLDQGIPANEEIVFRCEDEYGLVEVTEDRNLGSLKLLTNRLHMEGSTLLHGIDGQRKQGLLPLLLHPHPRRVLEIGLGTGIKLSAARPPLVEEVVAVEISPGVIQASRLFSEYNHHVGSDRSEIQVVCADGRNFTALTPGRYDLIANGLLTPYRAGISRLYTVEHFQQCRTKLASGGMFVVWIAVRQIGPDDLKVIARTLMEVFPHTTVWLDRYYLALIATVDPFSLDADILQRTKTDVAWTRAFEEAGIASASELLATYVAGPRWLAEFTDGQPLNTEDRPIIEFRAPRLGERLNTNELAAEFLTELGPLEDSLASICPSIDSQDRDRLLAAHRARWTANRGLAEKCMGRNKLSVQLFRQALEKSPADNLARYEFTVYLYNQGRHHLQQGQVADAHRLLQQAIHVNPRDTGALVGLATLEKNLGHDQRARQLVDRVLALDPHNRRLPILLRELQ